MRPSSWVQSQILNPRAGWCDASVRSAAGAPPMHSNLPATLVDLAEVRSDLMSPHDRDINRYPAFTSLLRVGAAVHYQFNFANTFAKGRGEYCAVSTGMYVQ